MISLFAQIRALGAPTILYRVIASLAGCAALCGLVRHESPAAGASAICRAVSVPNLWAAHVAGWVTVHEHIVVVAGMLMIALGILALPVPDDYGRDVGLAVEWRSPSTTVLGLAGMLQAGRAGVSAAVLVVALCLWLGLHRGGPSGVAELVVAAFGALLVATVFVPLYGASWLFTRDVRDALHGRDEDALLSQPPSGARAQAPHA